MKQSPRHAQPSRGVRRLALLSIFMLAALANAQQPMTREIPQRYVRGMGETSATWRQMELPSGPAGVLHIAAQDESAAQLWMSMYLSHSQLNPETSVHDLSTPYGKLVVIEIAGQGVVTAISQGASTWLLSAATPDALPALIEQAVPAASRNDLITRPAVEVPMWLDYFAKHGFRAYYRPWELPPGKDYRSYDITQEFSRARQLGDIGMGFWSMPLINDTAEGMMDDAFWEWAATWNEAEGLPAGLNMNATAPTWMANHFRDQTARHMPQYIGDFYRVGSDYLGREGLISWNADQAKDVQLGLLQNAIAGRLSKPNNYISILEPHGELAHGPWYIFMEYGDLADRTFRQYLQEKYDSLDALSQAWLGDSSLGSWDDVRVPEVASFLGWGEQALDLTGTWRMEYTGGALDPAWLGEHFDDTGWPTLTAPGDETAAMREKKPAVMRRTFDVDPDWLNGKEQVWLYLWDLNGQMGQNVNSAGKELICTVNGQEVGRDIMIRMHPHWGAWEITDALRSGENQIAVHLPDGIIAYRAYLSPEAPKHYPQLGEHDNARWADFMDWIAWSRARDVKRGAEMVRQVAPDREMTFMSPDEFIDRVKVVAEDYGGNLHNTGYMAAFWSDLLPSLMRSSGLPMTLEPGGPARELPEFKRMMGLYLTEGIQGVDYFIHIGNLLWPDDIREEFAAMQPMLQMIGRYRLHEAQIAVLYSNRTSQLLGYPWKRKPNVALPNGYWDFNMAAMLRGEYAYDGVTRFDFGRGNTDRYPMIIDSNTSIMDEPLIDAIREYVSNGGVFVTYAQSGRSTSTHYDSWPISELTGYRVVHIDQLNDDGQPRETRRLKAAPGQDLLEPRDVPTIPANGLTLEPVAKDTTNLLLWEDGSVAAGMRRIGKGYIVQLGAKFVGDKIGDRYAAGAQDAARSARMKLFEALFRWQQIDPLDASLSDPRASVILQQAVTTDGFFDVFVLWNESESKPADVSLQLGEASTATYALDVGTGKKVSLTTSQSGRSLDSLHFEPLQTRMYLTPRYAIGEAPLTWYDTNSSWWRSRVQPSEGRLPAPEHPHSLPLTDDWAMHRVDTSTPIEKLIAPATSVTNWPHVRMGIVTLPEHPDLDHVVLRRQFTVPRNWTNGRVELWLVSQFAFTFLEQGRVFIDGRLVQDWTDGGIRGENYNGLFKPGTTHEIAVEMKGQSSLVGARGTCWLYYRPSPSDSIDLAGRWESSDDALHFDGTMALPGEWNGYVARRTFDFNRPLNGRRAVLSVESDGTVLGAVINGHYLRALHHRIAPRVDLDITPWIRPGEPNTIVLQRWHEPGRTHVPRVAIDLFDPEVYP